MPFNRGNNRSVSYFALCSRFRHQESHYRTCAIKATILLPSGQHTCTLGELDASSPWPSDQGRVQGYLPKGAKQVQKRSNARRGLCC